VLDITKQVAASAAGSAGQDDAVTSHSCHAGSERAQKYCSRTGGGSRTSPMSAGGAAQDDL
jgi:hypothetical protein